MFIFASITLSPFFNIDEKDLYKAIDVKLKRGENVLNREERKQRNE